ncbi:hypothetical protein P8452_01738 [Trifolium repens]|nr:hypothetical protein P8452_01738 [Trifolium repens]
MEGCDSQVLVKAIYFSSLRGKTLVVKIKRLLELDWKLFSLHHRVTASLSSVLSNFFPSHAQASSVHHHVLQLKQDTGLVR